MIDPASSVDAVSWITGFGQIGALVFIVVRFLAENRRTQELMRDREKELTDAIHDVTKDYQTVLVNVTRVLEHSILIMERLERRLEYVEG